MKTLEQRDPEALENWRQDLAEGKPVSTVFLRIAELLEATFAFSINPLPTLRNCFPDFKWQVLMQEKGGDLDLDEEVLYLFEVASYHTMTNFSGGQQNVFVALTPKGVVTNTVKTAFFSDLDLVQLEVRKKGTETRRLVSALKSMGFTIPGL